jgi:hypothetical protein
MTVRVENQVRCWTTNLNEGIEAKIKKRIEWLKENNHDLYKMSIVFNDIHNGDYAEEEIKGYLKESESNPNEYHIHWEGEQYYYEDEYKNAEYKVYHLVSTRQSYDEISEQLEIDKNDIKNNYLYNVEKYFTNHTEAFMVSSILLNDYYDWYETKQDERYEERYKYTIKELLWQNDEDFEEYLMENTKTSNTLNKLYADAKQEAENEKHEEIYQWLNEMRLNYGNESSVEESIQTQLEQTYEDTDWQII